VWININMGNRWEGGKRSNYISEVDDYLADDSYHSVHTILRESQEGQQFCLKELCITVTSTLIKQFHMTQFISFFN
jgi:hypothetical protein